MDEIALQFSGLLGITKESSYLIIGVVLGFILGRVLRPRGTGVNFAQAFDAKNLAQSEGQSRFSQAVRASSTSGSVSANGQTFNLEPQVLGELRDLIQGGNKIEAIKKLREATGLGLAESKQIVEALEKAF